MDKLIVVIPALNEEASLASVIGKIPRGFDPGLAVEVLVVNDGSTDRTVEVAFAARADHVISTPQRRGLGAAVRAGLQEAYRLGADVAVMIDADDEYPAEYIPEAVAPIRAGEADYVLASRFAGLIRGMKVHRRLGNYFFTALQMVLLRRKLTDGQTGFRAFSRAALDKLDIIHDYNYAQVMTLNLVRQGFRLAEVPIPYKVRTTGTSFIRFWPYMSRVLPAIVREMSRKPGRAGLRPGSDAGSRAASGSNAKVGAAEMVQPAASRLHPADSAGVGDDASANSQPRRASTGYVRLEPTQVQP